MFLMKPEAIDRHIRHYRRYMLAGACLFAMEFLLPKVSGVSLGLVVSGVMAVMLGAVGGACHTWRTEKGIWMLSALFFLPSVALFLFFEIYQWMSMDSAFSTLQGAVFTVDSLIATWLLLKQVRFLASVTLYNRGLSRQMSDGSKDGCRYVNHVPESPRKEGSD